MLVTIIPNENSNYRGCWELLFEYVSEIPKVKFSFKVEFPYNIPIKDWYGLVDNKHHTILLHQGKESISVNNNEIIFRYYSSVTMINIISEFCLPAELVIKNLKSKLDEAISLGLVFQKC